MGLDVLREKLQRMAVLREQLVTALAQLDAPLRAAQAAAERDDPVGVHAALEGFRNQYVGGRIEGPFVDNHGHMATLQKVAEEARQACHQVIVERALAGRP